MGQRHHYQCFVIEEGAFIEQMDLDQHPESTPLQTNDDAQDDQQQVLFAVNPLTKVKGWYDATLTIILHADDAAHCLQSWISTLDFPNAFGVWYLGK